MAKVAILMWCIDIESDGRNERGDVGTIEGVYTTAAKCIEELKTQIEAEHYDSVLISTNGPVLKPINDSSEMLPNYETLQKELQEKLDGDYNGMFYIKAWAMNKRGRERFWWYKIMVRNLH